MADMIFNNNDGKAQEVAQELSTFENVEAFILPRLKNVSQVIPDELTEEVSFDPDVRLTYFVDLPDIPAPQEGRIIFPLTHSLLKMWDKSIDIRDIAFANAQRKHPSTLISIEEVLGFEPDEEEETFYVLSNGHIGAFGAVSILYPGITEKLEKKFKNFSVLPSSVHEVLIVPDSLGISMSDLKDMVPEVNGDYVEAKDILSDACYHYDPDAPAPGLVII